MSQLVSSEALELIAWLVFLVEIILAFYVLLLNPRHTANRHTSALLLFAAASTLGVALLLQASDIVVARLAAIIISAAAPTIAPLLIAASLAIFKPQWLQKRHPVGWLVWGCYILAALPVLLTAIDVVLDSKLYYTGLDARTYAGGYVGLEAFMAGPWAPTLRLIEFQIMTVLAMLVLVVLVVLLLRTQTPAHARRAVWVLVIMQGAALAIQIGLREILPAGVGSLSASLLYTLAYSYAVFGQTFSEQLAPVGRLQNRLTAMVLAVAVPLFVGVLTIVNAQAERVLENKTVEQLAAANRGLGANVSIWLELNIQALQQIAVDPAIVSMDPNLQRPVLQRLAQAHPYMYLTSTTDLQGMNVARNDDEAPKDYADRTWFQGAVGGQPAVLQTLVGRTSGVPALVVSMPIRDAADQIVGVVMFAANLTDIGQEVQATTVGEEGYAYVVDSTGQVVAHPNPEYTAELRDLSAYPPVAAIRQGRQGVVAFGDETGRRWRAWCGQKLARGWVVVVQQPEDELFAVLRARQRLAWGLIASGVAVLLALTWLSIRQAVRPVTMLTETATAIAAGDLERRAPVPQAVESRRRGPPGGKAVGGDEISRLAQAFNSMTDQLRGLIGNLEQRVAERTTDLERRSRYLQASSEVGQAATSILDSEELSREVVDLIRDRFGLYYVGLFLVEEASTEGERWATLRAGTGAAGQAMVARGHRIQVGQGMVGWSIAHAEARVALEAGADAVRLATPELPETRSEAAIPLRSRGRVLGALTVQSTQPSAFDPDAVLALQAMADQVAVALDNADLYAESQAALASTRLAFGEMSREAWLQLLRGRGEWGYRYTADRPGDRRESRSDSGVGTPQRSGAGGTITPLEGALPPEVIQAAQTGQTRESPPEDGAAISVPIRIRDQVVGVVSCRRQAAGIGSLPGPGPEGALEGASSRRGSSAAQWSDEERVLLDLLVDQASAALESARLFQDTQRRAAREQLTGQVTAQMRETLDIDTVLQTAVREIGAALNLAEVEVRMRPGRPSGAGQEVGQ